MVIHLLHRLLQMQMMVCIAVLSKVMDFISSNIKIGIFCSEIVFFFKTYFKNAKFSVVKNIAFFKDKFVKI